MKTLACALICVVACTVTSSAIAAPEYALNGVTEVYRAEQYKVPFYCKWSNNSGKLAFINADLLSEGVSEGNLFILDLHEPFPTTQMTLTADRVEGQSGVYWHPDDSCVYVTRNASETYDKTVVSKVSASVPREIVDVLTEETLGLGTNFGGVSVKQCTVLSDGTTVMICNGGSPGVGGRLYMTVKSDGFPDLSSVRMLVPEGSSLDYGIQHFVISPDGDNILISRGTEMEGAHVNIYLLTGVRDVVSGISDAYTELTDPRIYPVEIEPKFAQAPSWSEDGSLIYYMKDITGNFVPWEWNIDEADCDIFVVSLESVLAHSPAPFRIVQPGNQGFVSPSRGGTRFTYGDGTVETTFALFAASLRISDTILLDSSGITLSELTLRDGSGTVLSIPAGIDTNMSEGTQTIYVFTPISPIEESQLLAGVVGIPVIRAFGLEGVEEESVITFEPAVPLVISYTDPEIAGLTEENLKMYMYNPVSGLFDIEVPATVDTVANTLTASLSSLTVNGGGGAKSAKSGTAPPSLVIGVPPDSDQDGLSDEDEINIWGTNPNESDTDHDGISDYAEVHWNNTASPDPSMIYNPDTNPTGTILDPNNPDTDGDGVNDGQEVTFGYDPLDRNDVPQLPIGNSFPFVVVVCLLLICFAVWKSRKFQREVMPI